MYYVISRKFLKSVPGLLCLRMSQHPADLMGDLRS